MVAQSESSIPSSAGEHFAIAVVILFDAVVFGYLAWLCYTNGSGIGVVLFAAGGIVMAYAVLSVTCLEGEFDFFSFVSIALLSASVITALLTLTATDISPIVAGGYGFRPHESTRLSGSVTALLEKQPSRVLRDVRVFYIHAGHHARMYARFTNGRVIRATLSPSIVSRLEPEQLGFYVAEKSGTYHVFVSHRDVENIPYSTALAAGIVRSASSALRWAEKRQTERVAAISSWHAQR